LLLVVGGGGGGGGGGRGEGGGGVSLSICLFLWHTTFYHFIKHIYIACISKIIVLNGTNLHL
jgi:hypothetical protein